MRDDSLSLSLLASCFIHGVVIILASIILTHTAVCVDKISCPSVLSMCRARSSQNQSKKSRRLLRSKNRRLHRPKSKKPKSQSRWPRTRLFSPNRHRRRQLLPKKSRSSPSKRNLRRLPNLSPRPRWPLQPGSKAAAAKPALVIFSVRAT